ncbi:MAG: PilN domain-containing protein [Pseudomonadota bacterium]|jgi:type IV pilus assembly protein PilN
MARINLLPWREERRKLRNRQAQTLFASVAVAAVLAVVLVMVQYDRVVEGQLQRNRLLEQEITAVDRQIKEIEGFEEERARLLSRKQIIEQLQANRSMMVHLFDEMARTIPEGVRLTSIKQSGLQLALEGAAESNARVSEYMKRLEGSEWMDNADLQISEAKGADARGRFVFTLRVDLRKVDGEDGEADEAAVAAGGGGS